MSIVSLKKYGIEYIYILLYNTNNHVWQRYQPFSALPRFRFFSFFSVGRRCPKLSNLRGNVDSRRHRLPSAQGWKQRPVFEGGHAALKTQRKQLLFTIAHTRYYSSYCIPVPALPFYESHFFFCSCFAAKFYRRFRLLTIPFTDDPFTEHSGRYKIRVYMVRQFYLQVPYDSVLVVNVAASAPWVTLVVDKLNVLHCLLWLLLSRSEPSRRKALFNIEAWYVR